MKFVFMFKLLFSQFGEIGVGSFLQNMEVYSWLSASMTQVVIGDGKGFRKVEGSIQGLAW